jgi:hypothetical protein
MYFSVATNKQRTISLAQHGLMPCARRWIPSALGRTTTRKRNGGISDALNIPKTPMAVNVCHWPRHPSWIPLLVEAGQDAAVGGRRWLRTADADLSAVSHIRSREGLASNGNPRWMQLLRPNLARFDAIAGQDLKIQSNHVQITCEKGRQEREQSAEGQYQFRKVVSHISWSRILGCWY